VAILCGRVLGGMATPYVLWMLRKGLGVVMFLRHEGVSTDSCPRRGPLLRRPAHSGVGMASDAATVWTNKLPPTTEDGHTPGVLRGFKLVFRRRLSGYDRRRGEDGCP